MIKLYKETGDGLLYWETWEHEGTHTIHWGVVGETGQTKELRTSLLRNAEKTVQKEMRERQSEGYAEREELDVLLIQYRLDSWGSSADLERRHKIEDLMNECLGWTGLGHCDGGDIGSETINICCLVVDPYTAVAPISAELQRNQLLEGATIAIEREEGFEVLYPKDFDGEFRYWYDE
jgi:hypothetical protein